MTTSQLYRLSGFALVIGMILSATSSIVSAVAFPNSNDVVAATNPFNILLSVVNVVGTILALLGFPGMYARFAGQGGVTWLVGVVLIAITGMLFGVALGLMGALVFPALASEAGDLFSQGPPPAFFALFILATLANVFGAILMAIPMIKHGIYAHWCGYVLLIAAAFAVLGFLNGPGSSSLISTIFGIVSPVPLYVVLGWAGYRLWSTSQIEATEPAFETAGATCVRLPGWPA